MDWNGKKVRVLKRGQVFNITSCSAVDGFVLESIKVGMFFSRNNIIIVEWNLVQEGFKSLRNNAI